MSHLLVQWVTPEGQKTHFWAIKSMKNQSAVKCALQLQVALLSQRGRTMLRVCQ